MIFLFIVHFLTIYKIFGPVRFNISRKSQNSYVTALMLFISHPSFRQCRLNGCQRRFASFFTFGFFTFLRFPTFKLILLYSLYVTGRSKTTNRDPLIRVKAA
jgi:hypothetical protein